MITEQFLSGHDVELLHMIDCIADVGLDRAPCRGLDAGVYHPDVGEPNEVALALCSHCEVRFACLALALKEEEPGLRHGWYGGLSPVERDDAAESLGLVSIPCASRPKALRARELRFQGWAVVDIASKLQCSRRQVHRYLREVA